MSDSREDSSTVNYVAIIFDSDEKGFQGLQRLRELNKDGEITLHAVAIARRGHDGRMEVNAVADWHSFGMDAQALHEAGLSINDGQTAIIAEVAEDWDPAIDASMKSLGGTVFRRSKSTVRGDLLTSHYYPDSLVPPAFQPHFEKET